MQSLGNWQARLLLIAINVKILTSKSIGLISRSSHSISSNMGIIKNNITSLIYNRELVNLHHVSLRAYEFLQKNHDGNGFFEEIQLCTNFWLHSNKKQSIRSILVVLNMFGEEIQSFRIYPGISLPSLISENFWFIYLNFF